MAWWDDLASLNRAAVDWLNRTGPGGGTAAPSAGIAPVPQAVPGAPGPDGLPSTTVPFTGNFTTGTPVAGTNGSPTQRPQVGATPKEQTTLDLFRSQLSDVDQAILTAEAAIRKDPSSTEAYNAQQALPALRTLRASITSQIAQEENRLRDEKEKKETEQAKPKNGDTRIGRDTYTLPNGQKVSGTFTEVYNNGAWSYVKGSAAREEGFAGQPQGAAQITNQVLTDGQGAYWTYDQATGKATAINGPAAGVKTVTDPDGSVWTQKPDGTKGTKLFDSLPGTYTTPDGRVIGYDKRTGSQVFNIDTQTPEGRALADRLQRATVEAAEQANLPKFGSAVAQYQSEASRRQGLAREELKRLTDLQKSGQISPDQAEAQFNRWMQLNVEGPLAGYKAAAEEERRKQEQENLTRQTTENARVEAANALRGRAGYEAGETAKAQALEVGLQTRSPEFIGQLGQFAQSLGQGKSNFQFDPSALDPAKFKAVQPNYDAIANQAMQRLFGLYPEARAQNVNVGVPNLPAGDELRGLMDGVRYSGPLSAVPQNEVPEPGQEAVDLGTGKARTVFSNGRYVDWAIPQS